ncbi:MAG: GNAT family N-acetyltransferase [Chthoniobacteraceae bacterium]
MNVRRATIFDANDIAEVQVSTWRDAYRGQVPDAILDELDISQRADFWHVLSAEHSVFVAVSEPSIVGFCSLIASRVDDALSGAVAEIAALYVSSRYWRRGIGRGLCSRALAASAAAGYSSMTVWVLASNIPAIGFYSAVGFVPDGATTSEQTAADFVFEELRMRHDIKFPSRRDAIPGPEHL